MRIAMWSGPRNLSTAMMYAFAARSDCAVIDEPFYAAYLSATGLAHPMQQEILDSQPVTAQEVIKQCLGVIPNNKPLFYQKQMTHHMVKGFPRDWLSSLTNVFLIRHPVHVLASYQKKRENPTLEDIGFLQQCELFEHAKAHTETIPTVIDSDDILANPERIISALCERIGIIYQPQMLSWPAGGNKADGTWAPHWYESAWKSTGFKACSRRPLPHLNSDLDKIAQQAMPFYENMLSFKLSV